MLKETVEYGRWPDKMKFQVSLLYFVLSLFEIIHMLRS